jgi:hypothetical protein
MNEQLEAAGLPDRVELNSPGSLATYGFEGPYMVAGCSSADDLEAFVNIFGQ